MKQTFSAEKLENLFSKLETQNSEIRNPQFTITRRSLRGGLFILFGIKRRTGKPSEKFYRKSDASIDDGQSI